MDAWMNKDLTMEWIATVWNDSVDPGSAKRMLVWDTFKCHFTSSVKSLLEESNTDIVAVPGGCTKFCSLQMCAGMHRLRHAIATCTQHGCLHRTTSELNLAICELRQRLLWWIGC